MSYYIEDEETRDTILNALSKMYPGMKFDIGEQVPEKADDIRYFTADGKNLHALWNVALLKDLGGLGIAFDDFKKEYIKIICEHVCLEFFSTQEALKHEYLKEFPQWWEHKTVKAYVAEKKALAGI